MKKNFRYSARFGRTDGQKGQTRRTLDRNGAWELLPRPPSKVEHLAALRLVPKTHWAEERQRFLCE